MPCRAGLSANHESASMIEACYQQHGAQSLLECRGESGWCSDVTSTHGAWRHAGVRFPLSGDIMCLYISYKTQSHVNSGAWFRSTDLWVMSPTR